MARHVPATRQLHLGRRDLLDASVVKDSLNALPGFKTSAGELHAQALSLAYTFYIFFIWKYVCHVKEADEQLYTSSVSYIGGSHHSPRYF
jgi:hypothetical protein